jgi:hypothetical protein
MTMPLPSKDARPSVSADLALDMSLSADFDTCLTLYRNRSDFPGLSIELQTEGDVSRLVIQCARDGNLVESLDSALRLLGRAAEVGPADPGGHRHARDGLDHGPNLSQARDQRPRP